MSTKTLIVISGPTAVGKTALAVAIAKQFKTVVLSADSRQVFKEMAIGTAKPNEEEMQGVTHFFIDHVSIHDTPVYDAAQYEKEAINLLNELFQTHDYVVMAGGSGMYVNAVLYGLDDIPEVSLSIRETLNKQLEQEGLASLLKELEEKDSVYYAQVDKGNARRIQRALEVIRATGNPFSTYHTGEKKKRSFNTIHIGLERDREELYERINKRMDIMLAQDLEEEAKALYAYRSFNALQTVGYKEVFDYLEGNYTREKMIDKLKQHTRNYAKRQLTWLKKDKSVVWFHPEDWLGIIRQVTGIRS